MLIRFLFGLGRMDFQPNDLYFSVKWKFKLFAKNGVGRRSRQRGKW